MAAGIGEASAILSVAQIGINLSKALITYIEEVKDAPSHIQRIGNEILTTSERLKDIGELVNQNPQTKVFSEEGINSAVRCSSECQEIIRDVKSVLCKGGWKAYPRDSEKDDFHPSLFSTLRWPYAKIRLEVPRAELNRIKIDLSLLFSAAMVLGASTTIERQKLAQGIPKIHKARAWATKRVEKAREMAHNRPRTSRARDMPFSDDEPEMLEDFLSFKEKTYRDIEEERVKARARTIQAEDDARRRKEEDAQHEVERKAVEEYKKNQQEQEKRAAEKRENFRKELERLGFESTQIQVVMESSKLDFQAASGTDSVPEVRPTLFRKESSGKLVEVAEEDISPSAARSWSRFRLSRWRSKKSTRDSSPEPSLNPSLSESSTIPYSWFEVEVWVIDICTNQNTKILASADWMDAKMKISRKDLEVAWSHFAKLRPYCRNRILEFLNHRREEEPGWTLCNFEIPEKWSPARLFSVRRNEQMIQLTLSRPRLNDQDSGLPRGRPKIEGPGGELPKRVAFDGGLGEESVTIGEAKSNDDDVLPMNTLDLRNKIAVLEKKRNGLAPQDYERLADLNDMIDYLRAQSKSDTNTTTIYEKGQTDPGKSDSIQEPVLIYRESIPNLNRRETIVEEDRHHREPSPPAPTQRLRVYRADESSIACHHPHDEIEIERDYSPGKLEPEGQFGVSNNSRYGPREHRDFRDEEDVVLRIPGPQPRRWQERSRSRSRPSRQDSFGFRGGPVVRRERSWERPKGQTPQPSKQLSKETDYYDYAEGGRLGHDRARSRQSTTDRYEEDEWYPNVREIAIRRDERSQSRPREKQHFSGSGSEYSSRTPRVIYVERPAVDTAGQSQALVLRAGASGLPYDYVRERVFNGGIRVRGDDQIGNPPDDSPGFSDDYRPRRRSLSRIPFPSEPAVSPYIRRPSRPSSSRRGSYRDRSWAPSLRRRLSETWHQYDSSEDEESRYPSMKRVDSEKYSPETELSDAEVIAQTLKQLTTIQDSDMPGTGMSAPQIRAKPEVGPSALKNISHVSSGPERQRSFPISGRKAHFEQDIEPPQPDLDAKSGAKKERANPADEESFLDRISEEPDAMTEDNEISHHQHVPYFPERPISFTTNQRSSFPHPPDLAPYSREAHLDLSPPRTSANGPIVLEYHGYSLASQAEGSPNQAAQEEGHEEVEGIRTISRKPTVYERVGVSDET